MRLSKKYFAILALAAVYGAGQSNSRSESQAVAGSGSARRSRRGGRADLRPDAGACKRYSLRGWRISRRWKMFRRAVWGRDSIPTPASSCHIHPAIGGSAPASNPQVAFANSQNRAAAVYHGFGAGARGALYQESGWDAGRRRA